MTIVFIPESDQHVLVILAMDIIDLLVKALIIKIEDFYLEKAHASII